MASLLVEADAPPRRDGARRHAVPALVDVLVVGAACAFVLWQLRPDLLLADTTATGGDLGAHVWGPAYLRDHLLPHGRLSGWAPDWYGGFPWLTFYFPVPNLLVVLLDVALPYNVAFKLVAVLGVVSLPAAAWVFGRLLGMARPGPSCLAVATLPFLFDGSFSIYGGNLRSTLAGEFSYAIGLALALLFLGVYARGLRDGRGRASVAALLALVAVSHVITVFFALLGVATFTLLRRDRRSLRFAVPVGVVAALLVAWWTVPFLLRIRYTTDLQWEKLTDYGAALFPSHAYWALALAAAGIVVAAVLRRGPTLWLAALAGASGVAFVVAPQSRLWNARLLPFWLLCAYLLAGAAVAEAAPLLARAWTWLFEVTDRTRQARAQRTTTLATPLVALAAALVFVSLPLGRLPSWFPQRAERSPVPDWVSAQFNGYERTEAYPEFHDVVETMRQIGRREGCGTALWEYGEELDRFGTSFGLSLLPHLTKGCIGSMKGLFDESSASAPYMLLAESELSLDPSRHKGDLPYRDLDVAKGVEHLRLLGVRYYLAFTNEARALARVQPGLRLLGSSGPWTITDGPYQWQVTWDVYRVEGAELVSPLAFEPVVAGDVPDGGRGWLAAAVPWFQDSSRFDVPLAAEGPPEWQRVRRADGALPRRALPPVVVDGIRAGDDSISFEVDRVGVPVLVKASYFPNWKAHGARGVWRVTPNHMVVIPTSRQVTLRYGTTAVDTFAWALTGLGVVGLVVLWRRGRVDPSAPRPPVVDLDDVGDDAEPSPARLVGAPVGVVVPERT